MTTRHRAEGALAVCGALVATVALGCAQGAPRDGGDDAREASPDGGHDGLVDAEAAGDEPDVAIESGPLTGVVAQIEMVSERLCDLDEDGAMDNVIADLGVQLSQVFVMAINAAIASSLEGDRLLLFHLPWVEDLTTPSDPDVVIMVLSGEDVDDPDDPTDDLSGSEPFYARAASLDACGEPLHYFADVPFEAGGFQSGAGDVPLPFGEGETFVLRGARTWGGLSEDRETFDLSVCGYGLINELGIEIEQASMGATTLLEALLAGGAPFGMPAVPGVSPDIDVDGDGLERFLLDGDGLVASCIDGDATEIVGRDCYLDPRMADGFSFVATLTTVGAVFAGREPGWEDEVEGTCEGGPPVPSLFDPL